MWTLIWPKKYHLYNTYYYDPRYSKNNICKVFSAKWQFNILFESNFHLILGIHLFVTVAILFSRQAPDGQRWASGRHIATCGDRSKISVMQIFKNDHSEQLKVAICGDRSISPNHPCRYCDKYSEVSSYTFECVRTVSTAWFPARELLTDWLVSLHSKVDGFTNRTDYKMGPLSVSPMGGPISRSPL